MNEKVRFNCKRSGSNVQVQGKDYPYVMILIVAKLNSGQGSAIRIQPKVEVYIQSIVLKKTLESISFERRRGLEEEDGFEYLGAAMRRLVTVAPREPMATV